MYYDNTLDKIKKVGLVLSLILGFIVISGTSAQAQWRDNRNVRDDRYSGSRYDTSRIAQQYGYRDGLRDGLDAAREGDRYHPQNSGDWQKGTNGYEDRYGSKGAYKQSYRAAYIQGYQAGYNRNGNRGNRGYMRRNY